MRQHHACRQGMSLRARMQACGIQGLAWAAPRLGELGAAEGHVLRGGVQRADALLQRQQALVDLRALQPRLPARVQWHRAFKSSLSHSVQASRASLSQFLHVHGLARVCKPAQHLPEANCCSMTSADITCAECTSKAAARLASVTAEGARLLLRTVETRVTPSAHLLLS